MIQKIKRAFKWHWNLLALGAGVAFAFLSGHPDVVLPASSLSFREKKAFRQRLEIGPPKK